MRSHNAGDNVAAIDPGVVQEQRDTMVALAEHFGNLDLTEARIADSDLVFVFVPIRGLVAHPVGLAQGRCGGGSRLPQFLLVTGRAGRQSAHPAFA